MAEIAACGDGQRVCLVDRIGGGTGQPIVAVGIKPVIQRQREGDRPERVVGLNAAADDRLLRP